jgi:hypothetical protein
MRTNIAKGDNLSRSGQLLHCLNWAQSQIESGEKTIVHIMRIRAGESHGRLIAEITEDGTRYIDAFEQGEISLSIGKHHLGPRILPWLKS